MLAPTMLALSPKGKLNDSKGLLFNLKAQKYRFSILLTCFQRKSVGLFWGSRHKVHKDGRKTMQVDYQEEKGNSGGFTILFFEGEKSIAVYIFYFYVFEILFILERGVRREKERERERETSMCGCLLDITN